MAGNHPVADSQTTCYMHSARKMQNTAVCIAVAFVVAAAAVVVAFAVAAVAYFASQTPACTHDSCLSWASAYPAGSHVAAAEKKAADTVENYCCVDKGVVGAEGDWLDLADMGFGSQGIHCNPFVADPEEQL